MMDECHAHFSWWIIKQNFHYWRIENPGNASSELVPRFFLKVTVWGAVGWYGIIGPYFCEDDLGALFQSTRRAIAKWFGTIIWLTYVPMQEKNNFIQMRIQWLQQDGAPPHTAGETRRFLKQRFGDCLLSLRRRRVVTLFPWPFSLWLLLVDVSQGQDPRLQTLHKVKEIIRREISNIPQKAFPSDGEHGNVFAGGDRTTRSLLWTCFDIAITLKPSVFHIECIGVMYVYRFILHILWLSSFQMKSYVLLGHSVFKDLAAPIYISSIQLPLLCQCCDKTVWLSCLGDWVFFSLYLGTVVAD